MFQKDLLAGKRILITGGGSGLGRSIAERYLSLGAEVVIVGRKAEVLEKTAGELGGRIEWMVCNVRDPDAIETVVAKAWEAGPLDGLVNNAAANFIARTETLSHRAVSTVLETVLHGTFNMTIAVGKRWIEAGSPGTILNILTASAFSGRAYTAPSAAAKAGVLAMMRSLAVEWGPKGIRVVGVAPGLFPTEGAWKQLHPGDEDATNRRVSSEVPLRRPGDHIELSNLCSYLMSDGAAYVTGECILIDGGKALQGAAGANVRVMQDWTNEMWDAKR